MRLIETLAAKRIYYSRSVPTLPDLLLIDIPGCYAGNSLALGRYYPVILETLAEACEFEAFLCAERERVVPPDLLDRRPSKLQSDDILFARYAPPTAGWPWVLLCCWPTRYTAMVTSPQSEFARLAYTIDIYDDLDEVVAAERKMLTTLGPAEIRQISPLATCWGTA
ncbi:hypothetical protein M2337_002392 [Sphingobium sp. B2D3A]|uniref:hypothetical protein n=1 Tax=unclassified Sphingobium TaxID=2611147 RepID=UPI0022249FFA|nr:MULTISPECIES: hypothetical protein [unclassified Sphingobium]MCW2338159.1 hypothetical protein [Sphingobium sp. B2D3A]MCW2384618.1 hypothetical protein [Sphingobium sp. B2D3D]